MAKVTEGPIFRRVLKVGKVTGDALDPKAIRKIVKERCAQSGLRGQFSAHYLPSGFVTEVGRQKTLMADAMKMTGHRSVGNMMDSEAGNLMGSE
ncbi:hypothetical protein QTI51_38010 [Variovorax sp. J22G73]|uniref:hypothetical protein n=1 Tax=unclassified Variovorax TaxID=663243 RepID=UPI00257634BB|nr:MULTISPECIES: hypothetical protein [unclassified Variovorax]MDM0010553.1 hypothetical protein [Variovorax sp. J22R203]MDM0103118.1 hypothetical protein [Variovorax sp. J22G73]